MWSQACQRNCLPNNGACLHDSQPLQRTPRYRCILMGLVSHTQQLEPRQFGKASQAPLASMVLGILAVGLGAAYMSSLSPDSVDDLVTRVGHEAKLGLDMLLRQRGSGSKGVASRSEPRGSSTRAKLLLAAAGVALVMLGKKLYCRYRAVRIEGATIVVTGASQGIGAAVAEELARKGAKKVVLVARTGTKLAAVCDKLNAVRPGIAMYRAVDAANPIAVRRLADTLTATPDILVNCAGAGTWRFLPESSVPELKANISAPFMAAMWTTRTFVTDMVNRGRGCIVNVQSPAAYCAFGGATGYVAGRWALRGLTEALRADASGSGVVVQEVVLAMTKSQYFQNNPGSKERIPLLGRLTGTLTVHRAAEGIVQAIESGQDVFVHGKRMYVTFILNEWCPWLVGPLVRLSGWTMRRKKGAWTPCPV